MKTNPKTLRLASRPCQFVSPCKGFALRAGVAAAVAAGMLAACLPAGASVASKVATRPGGNVPAEDMPVHGGGGPLKPGQVDKENINSRDRSYKSSEGRAYDHLYKGEMKPVGGSMTGGSPDNQNSRGR